MPDPPPTPTDVAADSASLPDKRIHPWAVFDGDRVRLHTGGNGVTFALTYRTEHGAKMGARRWGGEARKR
jgi:hypothetical protein